MENNVQINHLLFLKVRRQEDVKTNEGDKIKCWIYFLPKFKPEMLQSEHFKNYHSNGNHGKPYNSEEDCNNVDDLELE